MWGLMPDKDLPFKNVPNQYPLTQMGKGTFTLLQSNEAKLIMKPLGVFLYQNKGLCETKLNVSLNLVQPIVTGFKERKDWLQIFYSLFALVISHLVS
jgi:hypothetical protein